MVLGGPPLRGLRSRLAPWSRATICRFATSGTANEPKVVISALGTACVKLPVSRVGKWGAMTATPYGAGYAIGRRLCLTERVMPNGASLVPFSLESQCYACQTRSVRHNSLPYDTGSAGTNLNIKQTTTHRLQRAWQPALAGSRPTPKHEMYTLGRKVGRGYRPQACI